MALEQRKKIRLEEFDYSQTGCYFLTICVKDKKCILCRGEQCSPENEFLLSNIGKIVNNAINNISNYYPNITVDKYVIMPNHIHMILIVNDTEEKPGRTLFAPTISRVIKQMKEYVTKKVGLSIWQKSFYDHVVRNEIEYLEILKYIETNPIKWQEDEYFNF